MTIRDIAIAFGYEVNKSSEISVKNSINSLKSFATKALGAIGIGVSLTQLNAIIEEFQSVNQQIKYATNNIANQEEVQKAVNKAANATKQSYAAMATTVTDLMNTHHKLFRTVQDTAAFAELTNKAFKSAGANESEINSLNSAIQNAFTTGKVSAGNFQTIMKSCPKVITYLSKTLGVTEQQVKALGMAGAITANQLYTAFNSNASAIEKDYGELAFTITDAMTYIKNEFGLWLVQLNETHQITQKVAKFMTRTFDKIMTVVKKATSWIERMSNKVGGIQNLLKIILITIGSISAAAGGLKIIGQIMAGNSALQTLAGTLTNVGAGAGGAFAGFKGLGAAIGKIAPMIGKACPWVLLIIAIIAALMVALEDLMAFFKGEDSVAGEFFKNIGISAEDMKNKITGIVEKIGAIFSDVFSIVGKVIGLAAEVISGALVAALTTLTAILDPLLSMVQMILDKLMPVLNKLLQTCFNILEKLLNGVLKILVSVLDMIVPILDLLIAVLEPLLDIIVMVIDAVLPILDILGPIIDIILNLVNLALQPCIAIIEMLCNLLNAILVPVLNMVKQLLEPLMGIIKSILSVLTPVLDLLSSLLNAILSPIIEILTVIINILSGSLGTAISFITSLLQPLIDGLTWVISLFSDLIGWITGGIGGAAKKVSEFATSVSDSFTKKIGSLGGKVTGWMSDISSKFSNAISGWSKKFFEGATNIVDGFKKGITGFFSNIGNWIKQNIFDPFIKGFKKLFGINSPSTVMSELGGFLVQGLLGGIKNLWSGITDFFSNALSGIKNMFSNAWSSIVDGAKNAWSNISEGVSNLASKVGDALGGAAEKVKNFASGVADKVSSGISNAVNGIKEAVGGTVNKAVNAIKDSAIGKAVSGAVSNAKTAVSNAVNTAKSAISSVASSVGAKVSEVANTVKSTVSSVVGKAKSTVSNAVNAVKESSVGKAVGGAVSKVKSGISSGLKKIGSFFGLANGGYIGANKPTPVVIGDNKSEGEIVSPISKMKNTMLEALGVFASAKRPVQAATTLNQDSSNRNITQNVSITNQFNGGPAQAQKDGAKAMKKSSNDATGEMARALAYAR